MAMVSNGLRRLALAAGLVPALMLASGAAAQEAQLDSRWLPWLGCWQPAEAAATADEAATTPMVCVVPVAGSSGVEVATLAGGAVAERQRLEANGQPQAQEREGCSGWESMEWSGSGTRLYQRSEYRCAGGLQRQGRGMMAMLPGGEWLTVQRVAAGEESAVRAMRYRAMAPGSVPLPEIAAVLQGYALATETARVAAAAAPRTADLAEASRQLGAAGVESWLIERGQGFALTGRQLLELQAAGVPGRVTDIMVALSHPRIYAIAPTAQPGEFRAEANRPPTRTAPQGDGRRVYLTLDRWGWGYPFSGLGYLSGYYGYSPYGYAPYGWYGRYGGYGWYNDGPVGIIIRDSGSNGGRGRLVKGQGYTQGTGGTASRPTPSAGHSSGTSSGSTAGTQGSGSSSTGAERTAKPREN